MRTSKQVVTAAVVGILVAGCSKESPKPVAPATPTTAPATPVAAMAPAAKAGVAGKASDLIIWADADPDSGPAPLTVKFKADPLENIENPTYSWNFGDDSPAVTGLEATHTYAKPGTYTARLTATDAAGNKGIDDTEIDVEEPEGK